MRIDVMSLRNDFPILISPVAAKAKPSDLQGTDPCTLDHFEVTG